MWSCIWTAKWWGVGEETVKADCGSVEARQLRGWGGGGGLDTITATPVKWNATKYSSSSWRASTCQLCSERTRAARVWCCQSLPKMNKLHKQRKTYTATALENKQQLFLMLAESSVCSLNCCCLQKKTEAVNINSHWERNHKRTQTEETEHVFTNQVYVYSN